MRNERSRWKSFIVVVAVLLSFIGSANAFELTMKADSTINGLGTDLKFGVANVAVVNDQLVPPPPLSGRNDVFFPGALENFTRVSDVRELSKSESWTLKANLKSEVTFTWVVPTLSATEKLEIYATVFGQEFNPLTNKPGRGNMATTTTLKLASSTNLTIVYTDTSTGKFSQAITFSEGTQNVNWSSVTKDTPNFELVASTDSNLPISFTSSDTNVATISGSTVDIISAGTVTFTAAQAGNTSYDPATSKTLVLNVAGAATVVTLNDLQLDYDGKTHPLTATSPDTSSFAYTYEGTSPTTYAKSATAPTNAGTYTVTATSSDVNYSGTATAKLTIESVEVTVRPNNATRKYHEAAPVFTYVFTGFVNGETKEQVVTGDPLIVNNATVDSPVGGYIIVASGRQLTARNYTFLDSAGRLVITKATPTITWAKPADIVYGTALGTAQLNATFTDAKGTVEGTVTYSKVAGTVLDAGADQDLKVSFIPTDTVNYEAPADVTVKLNVTKVALTAKANDISRHFTEVNPTLAVTYSGFVNGDDTAKLDTAAVVTTTAVSSSPKGSYPITFTTAPVDANYTITTVDGALTVTNEAPVIRSATKSRAVNENTPVDTNVGATVTATDADSAVATETLMWSLVDATGTFKIDAASGQIMVADATKVDFETQPSVTVAVTATDAAGEKDTQNVTLKINNVNEAPVATGTVQNPQKVITGRATTFMVGATDVDGETLGSGLTVTTTGTITMNNTTTSTNSGNAVLTINADGTCAFDAKDAVAGAMYTFTYTVTDAGGLTSDKIVTLTLIDNEPPTVASTPSATTATVAEGSTQTFSVTVNDKDHSPQDDGIKSIVWKAEKKMGETPWEVMGTPKSSTYTPAAGQSETDTFDLVTDKDSQTHADTIEYRVTVTVTDGADVSTMKMWMVTVTDMNSMPTVTKAIADGVASEDAAYSFTFATDTFADMDAEDAMLTYTFTATTTAQTKTPSWLSFDAHTRMFSGTPNNEDVGTVTVVVTATDTDRETPGTVTDTFDIVVSNTNDKPAVATAIVDQSATEDSAFTFTLDPNGFTDVDSIHGDKLTYTTTDLPAWLTFNATTRTFSGTPLNGNVGPLSVSVTAEDTASASITDTFVITVANTNDLPTIASVKVVPGTGQNLSKPSGITGLTVNFTVNDDDDGDFADTTGTTVSGNDSITYNWMLTRKGQDDSSIGTTKDIVPPALQKGDKIAVTVTVNDGETGSMDVVAIKRITIGNPPWFPSVTPAADVKPLTSFNRATITSMTSSEVVAVVYFAGAEIKATDYLTANWTPSYVANGHLGLRAGEFTAVVEAKQDDGSWMATDSKPIAITVDPFTIPVATDLGTATYSGGILTYNVSVGDDSQGYMVKYADQSASTTVEFKADAEGAIATSKDVAITRAVSMNGSYEVTVTPFNPDGLGAPVMISFDVKDATAVTVPPSTTDWGVSPVGGTPDGNDITNKFPVVSGTTTVTLNWNKIPEATKYYVLVTDEAGDAVSPELNRKLVTINALDAGDKVSLDVALPAGTYGWYVIAANDNGFSAWSDADTANAGTQSAWFTVQGDKAIAPKIAVPTFSGFTFSATAMNEIVLAGKFMPKYGYEVSFYNFVTGKKEMAEVHLDPAGPELTTLTVKLPSDWSVNTKYSVQIRAEADGPDGNDVYSKWTTAQSGMSPVSLGGTVDVVAKPTISSSSIAGSGMIEYVVYAIDPAVGMPVVVVPVTIKEGPVDISSVMVPDGQIIYVVARTISGTKKSEWAEFAELVSSISSESSF